MPGQAAGEDLREATLCLMNAERAARGLGRLQAEPLLGRVAASYARQMVRGRFFDHTSPGGVDDARAHQGDELPARRDARGRWARTSRGARGALATPRAIVRAWMHSPGHRANILDRPFPEIGIGVAAGAPVALEPGELGGTYMTDFGRRLQG